MPLPNNENYRNFSLAASWLFELSQRAVEEHQYATVDIAWWHVIKMFRAFAKKQKEDPVYFGFEANSILSEPSS